MKLAALIPCRKGSKGIPDKNFKELCGKPLWKWTLDEAIKSGIFDKIILSSDGGFKESFNGKVILDNDRPSELATDIATTDQVLTYYSLKYPEVKIWCILQATSPLRIAEDIKKAYNIIKLPKYDSLVSVTQNPGMLWIDNSVGYKDSIYPVATYHIHKRPMRQDRKDWYMENGAIYFTKKYVIDQMGARLGGKIALYPMPQERSLEIDSEFDWKIAEFVSGKAVS